VKSCCVERCFLFHQRDVSPAPFSVAKSILKYPAKADGGVTLSAEAIQSAIGDIFNVRGATI
jgi:hypothetical protein